MEQRYRVIERLEAGGMAEVFRGEATSMKGFRKKVAIKRVLPHLAQNEKFMAMFLDEARLGARLNHANIVSVFDIGVANDTYFIVLEYVDGPNLKRLGEALRKQGQRIGLAEAIYICMEACRGLNYAHELLDEEGQPLSIVHRDISPPNIMLSRRGETKLTDFGLAKAATQLERTDPGVVKGKFSYLSPEAASGEEVDARADIFGLGIVLWELLAGRRLFLGSSDYQTVRLVQQAAVPDLMPLHPEVDGDFQTILLQALTRDRNERYATAREFGDALAGYLFSHQLKVTSYDIANLIKTYVLNDRPSTAPHRSPINRLIQEELERFTSIEDESIESGAEPLSPRELVLSSAMRGSGFEHPGTWFEDDFEVASALDTYIRHNADKREPDSERKSQVSWVESGQGDLASVLEHESRDSHTQARSSLLSPVPQGESNRKLWLWTVALAVLASGLAFVAVWLLSNGT